MIKIETELIKKVKKIKGNLLTIDVEDEKILKSIEDNSDIVVYNSLNSNSSGQDNYGKRSKVISIKKIRRVFKRKRVDYIIGNISELKKHMRHFIKDSIYIGKKEIILYGNIEDYDLEVLKKRYKRYDTQITIKQDKDNFIIYIDVEKSKNNKIKDFFYFIGDTLVAISDFITDVLVH